MVSFLEPQLPRDVVLESLHRSLPVPLVVLVLGDHPVYGVSDNAERLAPLALQRGRDPLVPAGRYVPFLALTTWRRLHAAGETSIVPRLKTASSTAVGAADCLRE